MDDTTSAMGAFYGMKVADKDLRRYRGKGPIPSTRALIEMLKAQGVKGATPLDIGGGVPRSGTSCSTPAWHARPVWTHRHPISRRRARRPSAVATALASPICTVTSSSPPTRCLPQTSSPLTESSTSTRDGSDSLSSPPNEPSDSTAWSPARHAIRAVRGRWDESAHLAQPGARVHPGFDDDRPDHRRQRPQYSQLCAGRTGVAGRALPSLLARGRCAS